jgi:hypothetical protein
MANRRILKPDEFLKPAPQTVYFPVILKDRDQHLVITVKDGIVVNVEETMPPRINFTRTIIANSHQEAEMRREEWTLFENPEETDQLAILVHEPEPEECPNPNCVNGEDQKGQCDVCRGTGVLPPKASN